MEAETRTCHHAWGDWIEKDKDGEHTRSRHCVICAAIQHQRIPEPAKT